MTSYPASTSNAAATDESTPPDIATRTRSLTAPLPNYRASSMQYRGQLPNLVNDLRQCTDDRVHVLRHAVLPERKAQRRHAVPGRSPNCCPPPWMIASTACRSRTSNAPIPLGAPILWPEMVTRVQPTSLSETGTLPSA